MALRPGPSATALGSAGVVLLASFYIVLFTAGNAPCNDTDGEATCKPPEVPMAFFYGGVASILVAGVLAIMNFRRRHATREREAHKHGTN